MHLIYCFGEQQKNPPDKTITIPQWNGDENKPLVPVAVMQLSAVPAYI